MIQKIIFIGFLIGILLPIGFSKNCGGDISCQCGDDVISPYTMKKDLLCENDALNIKNSLNCNGFSIKGSGGGVGISIKGMDKKYISNCSIENFEKGLILGDIGTNDKSELNIISNSYFKDNTIGILIGTYVSRNKIIKNVFENNDKSIKTTNGAPTTIINNTFLDSTISMESIGAQKVCEDGNSNFYLGSPGPNCNCFLPQDDVLVNTNVKFCPGVYYVPSGIKINTKANILCEGTQIVGGGFGVGITAKGSEYTSIDGCIISNYSRGVEYSQKLNYNPYGGSYVILATNNAILNTTIKNVDVGVSLSRTEYHGDSKAEIIQNSTIIGKKYAIYNPTQGIINAKNNYYGTNKKEIIKSKFKNSSKIIFEPYIKKNMSYKLSFGNYTYNKDTIIIEMNSEDFLIDSIPIKIIGEKGGEIIFEEILLSNFSYEKIKTIILENNNYDAIYLKIDPNLEKLEEHTKKSQLYLKLNEITYNLKFSSSLDPLFKSSVYEFMSNQLFVLENNSDKELYLNKINMGINFSYGFNIISSQNNIEIQGQTIEGIISGILVFLKNKHYFENTITQFNSSIHSQIGLKTDDFFKLEENNKWYGTLTPQFKNITLSALTEDYFSLEFISIPVPLDSVSNDYIITKRKPINSQNIIRKIPNSNFPIILSGGLWSSITSFKEVAEKLTKKGYTTYTIEMNGGDHLECESCYNYNYVDLTKIILPSLISEIKKDSNSEKIIYIGHSNGGRVFLDSIENNNIKSSEIFSSMLLGVPGAFEDLSQLGKIIKLRGAYAIEKLKNKNITHISQSDMSFAFSQKNLFYSAEDILLDVVGMYLDFSDEKKISTNLFSKYFSWINSSEDIQPGKNISIDNFLLISGNPVFLSENDIIVSIKDEEEIFDQIISKNKKYIETNTLHFDMTNNEEIFNHILTFLETAK